jgi:hypothetical protein
VTEIDSVPRGPACPARARRLGPGFPFTLQDISVIFALCPIFRGVREEQENEPHRFLFFNNDSSGRIHIFFPLGDPESGTAGQNRHSALKDPAKSLSRRMGLGGTGRDRETVP